MGSLNHVNDREGCPGVEGISKFMKGLGLPALEVLLSKVLLSIMRPPIITHFHAAFARLFNIGQLLHNKLQLSILGVSTVSN